MRLAFKITLARVVFYIGSVSLAILVTLYQHTLNADFIQPPDTVVSSSPTDNSIQWQQMAVQVASDTTALLTTLATALLGALVLLFTGSRENPPNLLRHRWSALLSAAAAGISLYYGYVKHLYLLTMLNGNNFNPQMHAFVKVNYLQFYALLAGFFFLADFVFNDFLGEN